MTAKPNPTAIGENSYPDELKPGTKLLHGQYEIEDFLNSGGFGITYLAKDSLDRRVVIKECFASSFCRRSETIVAVRSRAHQAEYNSIVKLFVQEAKNLAKLKHPNIVGVHQIFEDNDTAYMALDFVDGRDLLELIEDPNDSMDPAQIQSMAMKLLDAVDYIHSAGVLHRDIAPDNILLERGNDNPVLIDFGAAREEASRQTRMLAAMRVVKDGYSPQEFYIQGSEQTPSSDLYALGATLYHLITGQVPPDSQQRLAAVAAQRPDPFKGFTEDLPGYSQAFLESINKVMQIFPYDRIQTAAEWLQMIRPSPEVVALPTAKTMPKRVVSRPVSRPISVAKATDVDAKRSRKPAEGDAAPTTDVAKAAPKRDAEKPAPSQDAFLNLRAAEKEKAKGMNPLVPILGAAAACIVVGLGVYFAMPGPDADATAAVEPEVTAPAEADAGDELTLTVPEVAPPAEEEVAAAVPEIVLSPEPAAQAEETVEAQPEVPAIVLPAGQDATEDEPMITLTAPDAAPEAVPETPVELAAAPETPLTTAPALAEAETAADTAPRVTAPSDPTPRVSDLTYVLQAGPYPDPDLPAVDVAAPAQPAAPVTEVAGNSAVLSGWTVALPFAPDSRDGARVGAVDVSAPDWLVPGARILKVNGRDVASIDAIPEAVRKTTEIAGKTEVEVSLVYAAAGETSPQTETLKLPAARDVLLLNGVQFRTVYEDGAWKTMVAASPETNPNGLRTGDQVIAYIPTSEKLDAETTISEIFERELEAGTSRFAFAVHRDGDLWVASVGYKGNN